MLFQFENLEDRPLYIDVESLKAMASVITALTVIGSALVAAVKWYLKQKKLEKDFEDQKEENQQKLDELREEHVRDIRKIEEEACLHTYGILACLKGLQEKGCNGPVTEAIDKFEKYINKRAHDQEE